MVTSFKLQQNNHRWENMGRIMLNIDLKDIKLNSGDQGELGSNTGFFFSFHSVNLVLLSCNA